MNDYLVVKKQSKTGEWLNTKGIAKYLNIRIRELCKREARKRDTFHSQPIQITPMNLDNKDLRKVKTGQRYSIHLTAVTNS